MENIVKIIEIEKLTHDVLRIVTEKPENYIYEPGQATDVTINQLEWKDKLNAFTFTSLPSENHLEFTIKTYPSHKGMTNQLLHLKKHDELILHDVFGDIGYKGEGIFIAGGAGVTPFISIIKDLESKGKVGSNKLIFANKTTGDIIHEQFFKKLLKDNFISVLSEEKVSGHEHGFISEILLKKHINNSSTYIYVCGPPPMMDAIGAILLKMGIKENYIVKEAF